LQPDIAASFGQPAMALCAGSAAAGNTIVLTPLNGYAGTPRVTFTSVPAGMTVDPPAPAAAPMPPAQSIPFTVAAGAAVAGPQTIVLNVADPAYGINRNVTLTVNVTAPDYTPSIAPAALTLIAGGAAQSITASIAPNACFTDPEVTINAFSLPPGVSLAPPSGTIAGPGYAPASFALQASPAAAPGVYSVRFEFASPSVVKAVFVTVTIALAPDFAIAASPASVTLAADQSQTITVTASGFNGFTGSVNVVAPAIPGVVFDPASFVLSAGASQPVTVSLSPNAVPGTYAGAFTATSANVAGSRTAPVSITVLAGPDFALTATPAALSVAPGGSASLAIGVAPLSGFAGTISVTAPSAPGITFEPASFTLAAGSSQAVVVRVAQGTPPQTLALQFSGTAAGIAGARTASLSLTVLAAPDFALAVTPPTIAIAQGTAGQALVAATGINGFTGPISVSVAAPSGVTIDPSSFTLVPGGQQQLQILVAAGAPLGAAVVTFTGTASGIAGTRTASLSIAIGPRPDFAISVSPAALAVRAGQTGTVRVSATGTNGFDAPIEVTAPASANATFTPASFTLRPGESRVVEVAAAGTALLAGPIALQFSATSSFRPEIRTAELLLTVFPPNPVVHLLTPGIVVPGTRSLVLRATGEHFQPGAVFRSSDARVVIEGVRVLSPSLADVTISVHAETSPGRYLLDVVNPDGGASAPAPLLVHSRSSIGAPLDVTAAAITFPAGGAMIAPGDSVFPVGLLATTGSGTIVGSWQFDGVAFDRFLVTAAAGMPVEVRTRIPIPISYAGEHRLEIVVEAPAHVVSPSITIVHAVDRASDLRLYEPLDGAVIGAAGARLFRWSLVPNCTGFLVEVLPGRGLVEPQPSDAVAQVRSYRVSDAEWRPGEEQLAEIGPGIHRWRVRPVCAGETLAQPSAWRRFAVLPRAVALTFAPLQRDERGRALVRWEGGAAGLLYRIEVRSPQGETLFSALTASAWYALDADLWSRHAGATVIVTAFGTGGAILGVSPPLALGEEIGSRPDVRPARMTIAALVAKEPAEGATVRTQLPRISARWSGAVASEQVALILDRVDVTAVATLTPSSVVYDSLLPLDNGTHTVRLVLGTESEEWTFEVALEQAPAPEAPAEGAAPAAAPGETKPPGIRTTWAVTPLGTITTVENGQDQARMQVSAQTDLDNGKFTSKVTGDVALKHELDDPNRTVQESRNWLGELGAKQGVVEETLRLGYAVPDFLDQAQLMTVGTARGGAQGKIALPFGSTSYYETFTSRPPGVIAGDFGPRQELRALAFQIPTSEIWDLRLIGLRVEDEAGFNSAGGKGDAFGIFARWSKSPALSMVFEGARGNFEPGLGSAEGDREGNAFRLGLSGAFGTLTYGLNLRSTDAEFVNPANRGFTPGGVPDRRGGDLVVTKVIGQSVLSLQLRRLQDGNASGAILPRTRSTGGALSFTTMLRQTISLALSGNMNVDRGDAAPDLYLPETDRTQSGFNGTLTEMFGRFSASQTLAFQRMEDDASPDFSMDIASATGSISGELVTNLNLSAIVSGTRSEGSAAVGTTDQLLVSLQPSWAIPRLSIVFQPRVAYNWSENDLSAFETKSEQVQGLVTYSPPWLGSLLSLQFSTDWSRNRFTGQLDEPGFVRNYAGTITFRWNAGSPSATAAQPGAPLAPNPIRPYQVVGRRFPRI
ncbi:MAG TPA: hypothetical protein VGF40_12455, partial [Thermoanaerobaculia bacterium]